MISDILSETAAGIRRYIEALPETYKEVRPEIDDLLKRMDALRAKLDAPPFSIPAPGCTDHAAEDARNPSREK